MNLRAVKYWLVKNSTRSNCWIVYTQIDNMLSHPGRTCCNIKGNMISPDEITISKNTLKYVYSVYMTEKILIALVEAYDGSVYIIKNRNRLAKVKQEEENEKVSKEGGNEANKGGDEIKENSGVDGEDDGKDDGEDGEEDGVKEVDIRNIDATQIEPIKSMIIKAPNLVSAINGLPKSIRHLIRVTKTHKMSLNKMELERLNEVLAIDFMDCIGNTEAMTALWNKYLKQCVQRDANLKRACVVDLSGNFNITPEVLASGDPQWMSKIREVVVYQNSQLVTWNWLKAFTNLRVLSFWQIFQINNEHITDVCKICPVLESVSIHDCMQINNRALLPMLLKPSITKICLDNRVMICQTNTHQGVITNKEWNSVINTNLEYLFINSDNLTNDVIDNVIGSCSHLKKFLMNTLVLKRLKENLIEGTDKTEITFQSSDDLKLGFKARRDIKIKNLLRDRYEEPFSESMKALMAKKGHHLNIPEGQDPNFVADIEEDDDSLTELERELLAEIEAEDREEIVV